MFLKKRIWKNFGDFWDYSLDHNQLFKSEKYIYFNFDYDVCD